MSKLTAPPYVLLEEPEVDAATHADNPVILQELAPLQELVLFQGWVVEHPLAVVVSVEVSHHAEGLLVPVDLQSPATSVDRETTVLETVLRRELNATLAERADTSLVTALPLTAVH